MKKRWYLALLICFSQQMAFAEELADTLHLNLEQAIEIAMTSNPVIKVADKNIEIKKVANKEAWQSLLPDASINTRLDHTIQAAEMKLNGMTFKMGEDGTNTVNAGLTVNIPLFAPSVYKAMSISKKDIELSMEKSRETKQDLVNQVTKAYYQLLLAQDAYEVMQESFKVSEKNYNVVSAKFDQGKVSEFDKISADVQLQSIRPNVVSAQNAIHLAALQLKVLLGVVDKEIQLNGNLADYEHLVINYQDIHDTPNSLLNNTTMKQLGLNQEILTKNVKMQKMSLVPTLGMSFNYQYQSIYNKNINIFNYEWAGSSSLLFNLSIPLYRAKNFTRVKDAQLKLKQLEWNRIDVERKLRMQIQTYKNNMVTSSEQCESNRKNIEQAQKAVTIANKRYEVGRGTVLELNSSQVALTQAQLVYNQSIYNYLVAKADLDKVLGKH